MRYAAIITIATLILSPAWAQDLGSDAQRQAGEVLYQKYCSQCHGESGDGLGTAAAYVKPRPRDFTAGKYKLRTTPTGMVPTHDDIKDAIRNGLPYTSMPAWPRFSERELDNLVYYLKSLSPAFSQPVELDTLDIPSPGSVTEESIARGREVYLNMGCNTCHGDQGRGDGASAPTLVDDWGYHLPPADFTQPWTFVGGSSREDIYQTFMTGLSGTPMPSYADEAALAVEDRWPLVDYVYSRAASREPRYREYVISSAVRGDLDLSLGRELFEGAQPARFPLFGQIMEPGRNFYPQTTSVVVRSVYSRDEIAFLVEWSDMRAETSGSNDPTLVVDPFDPVVEDAAEKVGPAGGGATDIDPFDPFGAAPATETAPAEAEAPDYDRTEFSDAVAVQFPAELPTGNRKPYFIFGDPQNPVDILFCDLAAPQRPRAYRGLGSQLLNPDQGESFEVAASYEAGLWSVVFKRKRTSSRSVSFAESQFVPIAFTVWDGFNRERGNKRALSNWYSVYLEPAARPSVVTPMLRNALAVFLGLILIIIFVRRSHARKPALQEETA